jgi:HD-GYP domain-containing protein (c-di-GMP phosphodiesterase class II)
MKRHPELGARILEHANLRDIAAWVRAHHERVDGRGYPAALSAGEIPVEARILAVADAYEAMTADRPYRRALPAEVAQEELRRNAGGQFDPAIVDAFLGVLADGGVAAAPPVAGRRGPRVAPSRRRSGGRRASSRSAARRTRRTGRSAPGCR